MATITRAKTGETEDVGETTSEFSTRLRAEREEKDRYRKGITQTLEQTAGVGSKQKVTYKVGGQTIATGTISGTGTSTPPPTKTQEVLKATATDIKTGKTTTIEPKEDTSIGVYDTQTQQTRLASPIESIAISKRFADTRQSRLEDEERREIDIRKTLKEPSVEKVYFKTGKQGVTDYLIYEKPREQRQTLTGKEFEKAGSLAVEGFFNPKSENFLDITEFFGNIQQKASERYKSTLSPEFELKYKNQALRTLLGTGTIAVGGAVAFGSGVVKGFTMPFRHPIETAKGFKELVTHPIKSGLGMAESFATDPFGTAGEFYGFGKGLKRITKTSPVKFEYEAFGEGGAKTFGVRVGYETTGFKGYPIITLSGKLVGEGFVQPKTAVGTTLFKKRIGEIITEPTEMLIEGKTISPELQREFATKGIESTYELRNIESKYFTQEALMKQGTKYLTPKESQAVLRKISEQGGKVFGSFSSIPQLEPSLRRVAGDIEAKYEISNEAQLSKYTKDILKALEETSPKSAYRILPEEPFHIEKRVQGQYQKVAEFKGQGIGEGDVAPEKAFGFDLWKSQDYMKVNDLILARLRGELKRKTAGSIMLKDTRLEVAHTGRFKDVPDLYRITETLQKSAKGRTPKSKAFLELAKDLGVEYRSGEPLRIELLKKEISKIRSPRFKSPSLRSPSVNIPSFLSPSPSARSPSISASVSPSVRVSPSVSPLKSIMSSLSPYLRGSLSPSAKSPSVKSPYTSPSPFESVSPSVSPSVSVSPSISISPSPFNQRFQKTTQNLKKLIKQSRKNLYYSPDFTARALGLNIDIKSEKQLKRLLKGQYSGLELARFGINV